MKSREILARNIKRLMADNKLTQAAMAKRTGVAQSMVGNLVRQEQSPRLELVEQIARAFKLPLWVLLLPPDLMPNATSIERLMHGVASLDDDSLQVISKLVESLARS